MARERIVFVRAAILESGKPASRSQEPAQADGLATIIAGTGVAGVSLDDLRSLLDLPPETLADVLMGLVASGQVVVLKVNRQMVYRAG